MPWVNAGQGNMIYVSGSANIGAVSVGPADPGVGTSGTGNASATLGASITGGSVNTASIDTSGVSPAAAAMATQEDRGGIAGPATETLKTLASMQADIAYLKAVVQKLIS